MTDIVRKLQLMLISLFASLWLTTAATTHTISSTFTTIEWNDSDGSLEVVLEGHAHELEILFSLYVGEQISFLNDAEFDRLERAAGEVIRSDLVIRTDDNDRPVKLAFLGLELRGQTVYAYLEAELPVKPTKLHVANQMFIGVMPGQINTVMGVVDGVRKAGDMTAEQNEAVLMTFPAPIK